MRTRQVNLDASFNKYTTIHPDRPMYSAKSMLKLIRWCRFFEREYKPIVTVQVGIHGGISDTLSSVGSAVHKDKQAVSMKSSPESIASSSTDNSITITKHRSVSYTLNRISLEFSNLFNRWLLKSLQIHGENISKNMNPKEHILHIVPRTDTTFREGDMPPLDYRDKKVRERIMNPLKEELFLENFQTEHCIVCQNKEYVDYDYGIPICQTCLYRRNLFLFGSSLQCNICEIQLDDDKFEGWLGDSWCKRCLTVKLRNLVTTEGQAPVCEIGCRFDCMHSNYDYVAVDHGRNRKFSE